MSLETKYEPGTHNVCCATCTRTIKYKDCTRNWDGNLVCFEHKEPNPYRYLKMGPHKPVSVVAPKDVQGPEVITYGDFY